MKRPDRFAQHRQDNPNPTTASAQQPASSIASTFDHCTCGSVGPGGCSGKAGRQLSVVGTDRFMTPDVDDPAVPGKRSRCAETARVVPSRSSGLMPTAMRIRPAVPADLPSFFEIRTSVRENEMSLEELASQGVTPQTLPALLDENARAWVAEHDCKVLAFVLASSSEARIVAMFVRPGCEGQGLGRQLMHQAEQWLFSEGCEEIWLVTDDNERLRANGFYRHLGWKVDDLLDGPVRFIKRAPGV